MIKYLISDNKIYLDFPKNIKILNAVTTRKIIAQLLLSRHPFMT